MELPTLADIDGRTLGVDLVAAIHDFNRFYAKHGAVLDRQLLDLGFTLSEIRILWQIADRDHITAQDMARELGMDATFLSKRLWRLKELQFVRTERSDIDGRIRHLRLTKKGQGAIRLLQSQSTHAVKKMIEGLSPANQRQLVEAMQRIRELLSMPPDEPWSWRLRDPRPGDYGWVISRHGAIYAEEYGADSAFEALVADTVARFIRKLNPAREKCWIAERDGARAGCIFLVEKSRRVGELRLLLVEPTARGARVGGQLLSECILFARATDYAKLFLWTRADMHAAHRVCARAGFVRVSGQRDRHVWELQLRAPAMSGARSTRKAP